MVTCTQGGNLKTIIEAITIERIIAALLAVLTGIAVIYALKTLKTISISVVFSFFVILLVYPLQQRVHKRLGGRQRWIGTALAMVTFVTVLAVFTGLIIVMFDTITVDAQKYVDGLTAYWNAFVQWAARHHVPLQKDIIQQSGVAEGVVNAAAGGISSLWSLLALFVIIFFLVLLVLVEADAWKTRFRKNGGEHVPGIAVVIKLIAHRVRIFLLLRTVVSIIAGVLGGAWLWILGTEFAFAWGVLIFLLNYIPYIGSIISVVPPVMVTVIQYGPAKGMLALAGLVLADQVIGNYVDPRLEGRIFKISPTVVFLSIIFWSWVWGVAGALLAVPVTITLVTTYKYLADYVPIATIFQNKSKE